MISLTALLGAVAVLVTTLVFALVTALTSRNVLVTVSGLAVLAVSSFVFPTVANFDGVQKAAVLAVLALLCLRRGAHLDWPVVGAFLVLTVTLVFSLLPSGELFKAPTDVALKAYLGYLLPWLFLLVSWRREHAPALLRAVAVLPPVVVVLGLVLQAVRVWNVISTADGTPRLEGASIPAHLALMAVTGAFAAGLELVLLERPKQAVAWLVVDLGILVATVTRGGILAALILVAALFVWSFTAGRTAPVGTRRAARVPALLLGGLLLAALPLLILRSTGNSYEGAFNTSGREQAWPFFFGLASEHPLFGRGLGFASIAEAYYQPVGVHELTAPHNEYLHLFVDGGVVLLVGYLVILVVAVARTARSAPRPARLLVWAALPAVLAYAATDNPFSTPQFSVPLFVALSAVTAFGRGAAEAVPARAPRIVVGARPARPALAGGAR